MSFQISFLFLTAVWATASPSPQPLHVNGFFRSYDFTRQNASNNPGARVVNQATLNSAIDVHADYRLAGGWYAGAGYFYANPLNGCSDADAHRRGAPCVSAVQPNLNPDDTIPGFILSTLDEAYIGYAAHNVSAKIGNQLFNSPWAGPVDTRVKPAAFQGADVTYVAHNTWTFEAADMIRFEPRTSSAFMRSTLLTSYPAGNQGLASNIFVPGCAAAACSGIETSGFLYGHAAFAAKSYSANLYDWRVSNIENILWGDTKYTIAQSGWKPFVALQSGFERNIGSAVAGKIDSLLLGVQIGASVTKNIVLTAGIVDVPWHYDRLALPAGVSCTNATGTKGYYQILSNGVTFPYFLPVNTAQCFAHPDGTTTVAYGGWASPYTDNYATNPVFTTQVSQGIPDRRAPGVSRKIAATYTSPDQRIVFIASDAWYDYGNAIAPERTAEWNLDGTFKFNRVGTGAYKGLQFRYRYAERTYSNTFCGAAATDCATGTPAGRQVLGGAPLFKYNRAMLEYDF